MTSTEFLHHQHVETKQTCSINNSIRSTWCRSSVLGGDKHQADVRAHLSSLVKQARFFYSSLCLVTRLPWCQSLSLSPSSPESPPRATTRHIYHSLQIRGLGGHLCIFSTMSSIPKAFQSRTSFKRTVMCVRPPISLPVEISWDSSGCDRAISLSQEDIFTLLQPEVDHQ